MENLSKVQQVNNLVTRLKNIASKALDKTNYEKALAAISVCGNILYDFNQVYTDEELESMLKKISTGILGGNRSKESMHISHSSKTVLFYDGFGLDTRGLALIFLKGLAKNNYKLIYVTGQHAKNTQPEIKKAISGYEVEFVYIDMNRNYLDWAINLKAVFEKYKPTDAFFYTTPYDVAATLVFTYFENFVTRYQIDLTDHAFWLGKYALDYCVELRDVGSKISFNYRGIGERKLKMLPYYAAIDNNAKFGGFEFNTKGYRVIFSGGALYKTLGDSENKYYKIIDSILKKYDDIIFVYAGSGDDSQLKLIMDKYPDRAFHIEERKDLYQVIRHCIFYLNTYPMFGGLMMNYAASAGRLPLTLKHNHDADGLLFNQNNLGIEFDTVEELLEEVDKLLTDQQYLKTKEKKLSESVISEERFEINLKSLIENKTTEYDINTEYIDTIEFRKEYIERFDYDASLIKAVARKRNKSLVLNFPTSFIKKIIKKINKE